MADVFLLLDDDERRKILAGAAQQLGRSAQALEKDVWVCWALEQLWATPNAVKMAFKGGTSLSKVYDAIERFSEDVDVTLDYRSLDPDFDPFAEGISKNKLKTAGERLRTLVTSHVHDIVVPHLRARLSSVSADASYAVDGSANGEEVRIKYRSVVDAPHGYIADSVLLEFGGRNITEPNEKHTVTPYIASVLEGVVLPSATVDALVGSRTFWEKATLMHVECNREDFKSGADRMSRHWCDLYKLADHAIGKSAVANRALLADVVKHKKVFFSASYANYDACCAGGLKLVPSDAGLVVLRADHNDMVAAGMFFRGPPTFDDVVARLRKLEAEINEAAAS
jgi:hypothetical protein